MKKLLTVLVTVILLAVCAVSVNAAETGTCGDNLTWTLDGDTLTISGTGTMYDYSEENPAPWAQWNDTITEIKVKRGVKSIGAYAFSGTTDLFKVSIPGTVTSIGSKAFAGDQGDMIRVYILGNIPTIASNAFSGKWATIGHVLEEDGNIKESYGGMLTWVEGELKLYHRTKKLYDLNEEIKKADISLAVDFNNRYLDNNIAYTPKKLEVGAYDNSTYGQKSVKITADGCEFENLYFVTDGQNHLDLVEVSISDYVFYGGSTNITNPKVTAGSYELQYSTDYVVRYKNCEHAGGYSYTTVTGLGIFEGYEKTFSYAVLKKDISGASVKVNNVRFQGIPVMPEVHVGSDQLVAGKDYTFYYENNVNVGTATVHIVGKGNYCGSTTKTFEITKSGPAVVLKGNYNGLATSGTVTADPYYEEGIVSPGNFTGRLDTTYRHIAYYELYRFDGEEFQLVAKKETEFGKANDTAFTYDFSSVYEETAESGVAIYMLSYAWVESGSEVYSGAYLMYIPMKVPDATSMVVEQVEGAGDFRRAYVTAYGPDGNVGTVEWTTSDPSVATVNDKGVVSFKKPGSVTVTGKYGNLTDSVVVTAGPQDIRLGDILSYEAQTEKAKVIFDGFLLTAGTDYTLASEARDGVVTVTVTGCGLFSGQLVREFDVASGEALDHSHSFDNSCDESCNGCDFARSVVHDFAEAWSKNGTQHWHACTVCGEKADVEDHTLSAVDNTVCTVCGSLYTPGDLDNNGFVDNKDVEYLLWYTLFAEDYPLNQDADFDGNGQVDNKDVEYLLWHTLFSEDYPLVR